MARSRFMVLSCKMTRFLHMELSWQMAHSYLMALSGLSGVCVIYVVPPTHFTFSSKITLILIQAGGQAWGKWEIRTRGLFVGSLPPTNCQYTCFPMDRSTLLVLYNTWLAPIFGALYFQARSILWCSLIYRLDYVSRYSLIAVSLLFFGALTSHDCAPGYWRSHMHWLASFVRCSLTRWLALNMGTLWHLARSCTMVLS
jgi:hypothetical protein